MNKRNIFVLGVVATAVFLSAGLASAEKITDDTGDVWHWTWNSNTGSYSWAHSVTNQPEIDIKEISSDVEGEQMVLKMKVSGDISSSNTLYAVFYNTTGATYYMMYSNGSGMCMAISGNYTGISYGNTTASGNTLTGTVNMIGEDTKSEFYGYAYKYTHFGDTSGEWWGDWAPQDDSPWYDTENSNNEGSSGGGGGSTPGFEILLAAGAIALAFVIKKK